MSEEDKKIVLSSDLPRQGTAGVAEQRLHALRAAEQIGRSLMRHVKVRQHETITCMQGHACGAMLSDLERDDPINSSDFLCTGDLHPNSGDWKGYECP